jgi:hypothetical protein
MFSSILLDNINILSLKMTSLYPLRKIVFVNRRIFTFENVILFLLKLFSTKIPIEKKTWQWLNLFLRCQDKRSETNF